MKVTTDNLRKVIGLADAHSPFPICQNGYSGSLEIVLAAVSLSAADILATIPVVHPQHPDHIFLSDRSLWFQRKSDPMNQGFNRFLFLHSLLFGLKLVYPYYLWFFNPSFREEMC